MSLSDNNEKEDKTKCRTLLRKRKEEKEKVQNIEKKRKGRVCTYKTNLNHSKGICGMKERENKNLMKEIEIKMK